MRHSFDHDFFCCSLFGGLIKNKGPINDRQCEGSWTGKDISCFVLLSDSFFPDVTNQIVFLKSILSANDIRFLRETKPLDIGNVESEIMKKRACIRQELIIGDYIYKIYLTPRLKDVFVEELRIEVNREKREVEEDVLKILEKPNERRNLVDIVIKDGKSLFLIFKKEQEIFILSYYYITAVASVIR